MGVTVPFCREERVPCASCPSAGLPLPSADHDRPCRPCIPATARSGAKYPGFVQCVGTTMAGATGRGTDELAPVRAPDTSEGRRITSPTRSAPGPRACATGVRDLHRFPFLATTRLRLPHPGRLGIEALCEGRGSLFARARCGDGLGDRQHTTGGLARDPAGFEEARAFDATRSGRPDPPDLREPSLEVRLCAEDADQLLHPRGSRARRRTFALDRSSSEHLARRFVTWPPGAGARFACSAAARPARRPNTSRSESELPPRRFAPCSPAATSPAAKRPGTDELAVSASTRTPPIM